MNKDPLLRFNKDFVLRLLLQLVVVGLVLGMFLTLLARPLMRKHGPLDNGKQLYHDGKYAEAAVIFRDEIRAHPTDIAAAEELGRSLIALQQYTEAIQTLQKTVTQIPSAMDVWEMLGEAYAGNRQQQEAVDAFQHVLALEPTRVHTHLMLGQAYNDMGKKSEAKAEWEKVITLDPRNEGQLAQKLINLQGRVNFQRR
ncbi:MAG: domain protein putative component of TonB system [Chthonomonadaceae bacterium]|jgi:tetratricopeptide (TPR) repeat protein|nr:domain protein putative component of TonB system [Chthonomonadaceae bacterium]